MEIETSESKQYREEMGDNLWYWFLAIDEMAKLQDITPEQVFRKIYDMNRVKLHSRYLGAGKYSKKGATERDLDQERKLMEEAAKGNVIG